MELLHKTDTLVRKETTHIARHNLKLQSRGQHVSEQRKEGEIYASWLSEFVSRVSSSGLDMSIAERSKANNFGTVAEGCGFMDRTSVV